MTILITGGSGLVGKALCHQLRQQGHTLKLLTRHEPATHEEFRWDITKKYIDPKAFEGVQSIVHLAGAPISQRWTEKNKREMYASRVDAANLLHQYAKQAGIQLESFVSASGINYYGTFTHNQILTEADAVVHHDFLSDLCVVWEQAAEQFRDVAERVVYLRTSMVLSNKGGALPQLLQIVNLNLSAPVGSGKQWMNWIHLEDMVNMYVAAIENRKLDGPYNALADEVPTNADFMKQLAHARHKLFLPIPVPSFVLKLIFGDTSAVLLTGTRADNSKIKNTDFSFKYKKLSAALRDLV